MSSPAPASPRPIPFGERIATLRSQRGWTQQELADRVALSRTALSHLEAEMRVASERTVVILSGVFGLAPLDLVSGTTYPLAKAERLPVIAALHTEVSLTIAVFEAELHLMQELAPGAAKQAAWAASWTQRLSELRNRWPDRIERAELDGCLQLVRALTTASRS